MKWEKKTDEDGNFWTCDFTIRGYVILEMIVSRPDDNPEAQWGYTITTASGRAIIDEENFQYPASARRRAEDTLREMLLVAYQQQL